MNLYFTFLLIALNNHHNLSNNAPITFYLDRAIIKLGTLTLYPLFAEGLQKSTRLLMG